MSSVLLNVGQCGNQIALQLLDQMESTSLQYEDTYFKNTEHNTYHSIHLDTEPKILRPLVDNRKKYWYIDPKNVLFYQHGRGNNWSLGYMDEAKKISKANDDKTKHRPLQFNKFTDKQPYALSKQTDSAAHSSQLQPGIKGANQEIVGSDQLMKENNNMLSSVMQMVRREVEKMDNFMGIHMLTSLGGGTGSGLGSRLIEEFRDLFSDVTILNTVVFPHKAGETTLQHYNCALTLAHLQTYSDCVIYFQNDKVNSYLNYTRSKSVEKVIDLTNINQYISSNLFNLFKINDYSSFDRFYFDLLIDAAPMDDYKFVEVYSTPYIFNKTASTGPESTWEKVFDCLTSQVNIEDSFFTSNVSTSDQDQNELDSALKQDKESSREVSLSVQTVFRSQDVLKSLKGSESALKLLDKKMHSTFNPVKWNPDCFSYEFLEYKMKEAADSKMMLTIANRSTIANVIQNVNDTAYSKFKANAYLHWYYQYGIEKSDFEDALLILDNIYDNYTSLKNYK